MIRCEHICKSFDGKTVLDDISARFMPGEINMIIGRSGSGKTVLLKSIAGLYAVDSGDIYYNDTHYSALPHSTSASARPSVATWE